jgi:hypothetical protein
MSAAPVPGAAAALLAFAGLIAGAGGGAGYAAAT